MAWVDYIVQAMRELGGYANYADLYRKIEEIHPKPLTPAWKTSVRQIVESNSSDSNNYREGRRDIFYSVNGIGSGVWGLRDYSSETPIAIDIENVDTSISVNRRAKQEVYRILRDTELARSIKRIHNNQCQICGYAIQLSDGTYYSEAHHIMPLGKPHNGPDIPSNVLCLCPNYHAILDYGVMAIEIEKLNRSDRHTIDSRFIDYHNRVIFNHVIEE